MLCHENQCNAQSLSQKFDVTKFVCFSLLNFPMKFSLRHFL